MNLGAKMLAGFAIGGVTSAAGDIILWLRTPGGWRANKFDWDVATKRWACGAVSGATSAAGLHVAGL